MRVCTRSPVCASPLHPLYPPIGGTGGWGLRTKRGNQSNFSILETSPEYPNLLSASHNSLAVNKSSGFF